MNKELFKRWLENRGVIFNDVTDSYGGRDTIIVESKEEYLKKKAHPRKYKNLYVPYLRISWYEGKRGFNYYVRDNGFCEYRSLPSIMEYILRCYV